LPVQELRVTDSHGAVQTLRLEARRLTLGRALENDLPFPDDLLLSRRHLAIEPDGSSWFVEDLGSRNGTLLNGHPLRDRQKLDPGAQIEAGGLRIEFNASIPRHERTVVFLPQKESGRLLSASIHSSVDLLAGRTPGRKDGGAARVEALLEAGRTLAAHRPLDEIFPVILNLAVKGVGAQRGLVLTLEEGRLVPRAVKGDDFHISRAVRDRVLEHRESLLVHDVSQDEVFQGSLTMAEQRVRSLMAVPLQTDTQVLGLVYVDSPGFIRDFTEEDLALLTVMSNIAAVRIEHARLLEVEQAEKFHQRELQQAAEIQSNFLPAVAPDVPGYELAGQSIPCRSVGGDYFDFVPLFGNRMAIVLGDVAGKGMAAALMMASLQARVHLLAEEEQNLSHFVTRLNRSVAATCPAGRFITLFILALDPATGKFTYVNAGHNPPYIRRSGGKLEQLTEGGPVIGILKAMSYTAASGSLHPGDTLVIYSDGLTEAISPADEEFGEKRLEGLLHDSPASAQSLLEDLFGATRGFMAGRAPADDLTMVVVRRLNQ